jgi:hypothetical protein
VADRYSLLKNSMLRLPWGGAAVYRCDNRLVFSAGFSRWRAIAAINLSFSADR